MNLVDSSGWLEYFSGGRNTDFFTSAIEDTNHLIVSTINIYEVFKKVLNERDENSALQVIAIMQQAKVKNVNSQVSLFAARLSYENKLPMADSLILATARINNAVLWTQDSDFKNFPDVQYISKK